MVFALAGDSTTTRRCPAIGTLRGLPKSAASPRRPSAVFALLILVSSSWIGAAIVASWPWPSPCALTLPTLALATVWPSAWPPRLPTRCLGLALAAGLSALGHGRLGGWPVGLGDLFGRLRWPWLCLSVSSAFDCFFLVATRYLVRATGDAANPAFNLGQPSSQHLGQRPAQRRDQTSAPSRRLRQCDAHRRASAPPVWLQLARLRAAGRPAAQQRPTPAASCTSPRPRWATRRSVPALPGTASTGTPRLPGQGGGDQRARTAAASTTMTRSASAAINRLREGKCAGGAASPARTRTAGPPLAAMRSNRPAVAVGIDDVDPAAQDGEGGAPGAAPPRGRRRRCRRRRPRPPQARPAQAGGQLAARLAGRRRWRPASRPRRWPRRAAAPARSGGARAPQLGRGHWTIARARAG